jgi:hypothetical protein
VNGVVAAHRMVKGMRMSRYLGIEQHEQAKSLAFA